MLNLGFPLKFFVISRNPEAKKTPERNSGDNTDLDVGILTTGEIVTYLFRNSLKKDDNIRQNCEAYVVPKPAFRISKLTLNVELNKRVVGTLPIVASSLVIQTREKFYRLVNYFVDDLGLQAYRAF